MEASCALRALVAAEDAMVITIVGRQQLAEVHTMLQTVAEW